MVVVKEQHVVQNTTKRARQERPLLRDISALIGSHARATPGMILGLLPGRNRTERRMHSPVREGGDVLWARGSPLKKVY